MQKDIPLPDATTSAMQRVIIFAEPGRHVRRGQQPASQIVCPRMVGTLDALDEMPVGLLAQARAAMTAHVEQRVNGARRVTCDDDALAADRTGEIFAGSRDLIGAPGADQAVEVEAVELPAKEVGVGIESARQSLVHVHRR